MGTAQYGYNKFFEIKDTTRLQYVHKKLYMNVNMQTSPPTGVDIV